MKLKRFSFFLGLLMLLFSVLTACGAPASPTDPSDGNTNTTNYSKNTDPTESTVAEPSLTAKDCFTFVRYGNQTFAKNLDIDPSALENNCLYVHNRKTGENYLIAEVNVHCFGASDDYIYYISLDGSEIIRSDYAGTNKTSVYKSDKMITWVDHCNGEADQLLIVEDRKDLSLLGLADGSKEFVTRHFCINEAFYRSEVSFYTGQFHREVEIQEAILWTGKHIEGGDSASYLFDMNTNVLFAYTGANAAETVHWQTPWRIDRSITPHRYRIITKLSNLSNFAPNKFDESLFKESCLYVLDTYYDVLYSLSDIEVSDCRFSVDYIYYSNGNEIIRSDYSGKDRTVVYQTDHEVTALDYNFREDKYLIVEDNQRAILFDPITNSSELLMEQKYIHWRLLYYYPTSLEFTEEDKGRTITWFGHTPNDEGGYIEYVYFVDADELIWAPDH